MRYDTDYCVICNSYLCFADDGAPLPDCRRGPDPDYDPYWEQEA